MPAQLNALQVWKTHKTVCVPTDMATPHQIYITVVSANPIALQELHRQLKRKQLKKLITASSRLVLSRLVVREKSYVYLPDYCMLLQGKPT